MTIEFNFGIRWRWRVEPSARTKMIIFFCKLWSISNFWSLVGWSLLIRASRWTERLTWSNVWQCKNQSVWVSASAMLGLTLRRSNTKDPKDEEKKQWNVVDTTYDASVIYSIKTVRKNKQNEKKKVAAENSEMRKKERIAERMDESNSLRSFAHSFIRVFVCLFFFVFYFAITGFVHFKVLKGVCVCMSWRYSFHIFCRAHTFALFVCARFEVKGAQWQWQRVHNGI